MHIQNLEINFLKRKENWKEQKMIQKIAQMKKKLRKKTTICTCNEYMISFKIAKQLNLTIKSLALECLILIQKSDRKQ